MTYRVPLAYNNFGPEEQAAMAAVIASDRFTQGREVEAFEKAFAAYHGAAHAILVNSGSSANLIAIEAIRYLSQLKPELTYGEIKACDEVVMPGLSWPTTIKPLLNHQLQPVFCDVELESLNIRPAHVEAVRTERTRAVVAVPILGNPDGLDELRDYCSAERLILIEDACESLGAVSAKGARVGTFGMASAFSFYFSHHISMIEGGAILTNSPELADLCYALRSHGWTRHLKLGRFDYFEAQAVERVDPRFCFFLPGYNVRSTELNAAIGSAQLKKLDRFVDARRRIARGRIEAVAGASNSVKVPGAGAVDRHSWMTFPLLFATAEQKAAGQRTLEAMGVENRPIIVGNMLRHPLVSSLGLKADQPDLAACDQVFERGLMIGVNPLSDEATEAHVHAALSAAAVA